MTARPDVVVVGGGIAGLTVAAEFAADRSVLVLEADSGPAQQTTGRSAAIYMENYGGARIRPFPQTGRAWLESGGDGAVDRSLLSPRGLIVIATSGQEVDFGTYAAPSSARLSAAEVTELFPAIRPERVTAAVHDPGILDLDAAGVVEAAVRTLRARGGVIRSSSTVEAIERVGDMWRVGSRDETVETSLVVNAAGAWSDRIAEMAGLESIGMQPLRRTICTFRAEGGMDPKGWPMLQDVEDLFYIKPETGQFLASPADQTPSEPCDPHPEMIDVATALERVREATTLEARSVQRSWAGLRTFAPDRSLVLGPDPDAEGFVWCAGHGGFGMMVAHSAARAVVSLVAGRGLPADLIAAGSVAADVTPDRFRR